MCAILFAPMIFMGMVGTANAQDDAATQDNNISGPGMIALENEDGRRSKTANIFIQLLVSISEPPTLALVS